MMSLSIIELFRANANPELAISMEAYMKNQFPFLGIPKPKRNLLQKTWIKEQAKQPYIDKTLILTLWNQSEREFQYLAVDLLLAMKKKVIATDLPLLQTILTTKPWWDSIDLIAAHVIGTLIQNNPPLIETDIRPWAHGKEDSIWLRRTAILAQLRFKENTDLALLEEIILANCHTKEFFLNKAIGWALREYAKTDASYVRAFVAKHPLHNLSVREACKNISRI